MSSLLYSFINQKNNYKWTTTFSELETFRRKIVSIEPEKIDRIYAEEYSDKRNIYFEKINTYRLIARLKEEGIFVDLWARHVNDCYFGEIFVTKNPEHILRTLSRDKMEAMIRSLEKDGGYTIDYPMKHVERIPIITNISSALPHPNYKSLGYSFEKVSKRFNHILSYQVGFKRQTQTKERHLWNRDELKKFKIDWEKIDRIYNVRIRHHYIYSVYYLMLRMVHHSHNNIFVEFHAVICDEMPTCGEIFITVDPKLLEEEYIRPPPPHVLQ